MSYVGISLIVTWGVTGVYLLLLLLNDVRRVHNNFLPDTFRTASIFRLGSDCALRFWFSRIDPALLTEAGQVYRERAIQHQRLWLAWQIVGFVLVVSYFLS